MTLHAKALGDRVGVVAGVYADREELLKSGGGESDTYGDLYPQYFGNHAFLYVGTPFALELDQLTAKRTSESTALFPNTAST